MHSVLFEANNLKTAIFFFFFFNLSYVSMSIVLLNSTHIELNKTAIWQIIESLKSM